MFKHSKRKIEDIKGEHVGMADLMSVWHVCVLLQFFYRNGKGHEYMVRLLMCIYIYIERERECLHAKMSHVVT